MLSTKDAQAIVNLVANDVCCRAVIKGPNNALFRYTGQSGRIRNFANAVSESFGLLGPEDVQRVSCIGISATTSQAVNQAGTRMAGIRKVKAILPNVTNAIQCSRVINGWHHHGCRVVMKDGTDYVFDWWRTMDPRNPWLYKTADWREDINAVPYISFKRFI